MKQNDVEFVPYGTEWEQEMNKFPKAMLIKMLRKSLIENQAVPDLLDACKKTRTKMLDIWGVFGGGHQVNELFEILNIAIAKAEKEAMSQ
jgi:hypothetical protein